MSEIKCYGTFWRWDLVERDPFWIYGWQPTYKHWRKEADNAQMCVNPMAGVYVLQDDRRRPLYIGQSLKIGPRLWSHTRNDNMGRWTHFSWFSIDSPSPVNLDDPMDPGIPSEDDTLEGSVSLDMLEAMLITVAEPPLNKQGGRWGAEKKFLQFSYYGDVSNEDLWRRTKKKRLKKLFRGNTP